MLSFGIESSDSSSPGTSKKKKKRQRERGSGSSEAQNILPETENKALENPAMPSDGMVEIKIDES